MGTEPLGEDPRGIDAEPAFGLRHERLGERDVLPAGRRRVDRAIVRIPRAGGIRPAVGGIDPYGATKIVRPFAKSHSP